jgi:hypothetical protein
LLFAGQAVLKAKPVQTLGDAVPAPLSRTDENGAILAVPLHDVLLPGVDYLVKQLGQPILELP